MYNGRIYIFLPKLVTLLCTLLLSLTSNVTRGQVAQYVDLAAWQRVRVVQGQQGRVYDIYIRHTDNACVAITTRIKGLIQEVQVNCIAEGEDGERYNLCSLGVLGSYDGQPAIRYASWSTCERFAILFDTIKREYEIRRLESLDGEISPGFPRSGRGNF